MSSEGPDHVLVALAPSDGTVGPAFAEELARVERELGGAGRVTVFDRLPEAPVDQAAWALVLKLVGDDSGRLVRSLAGMGKRLGDAVADAEVIAGVDRAVFTNALPPAAVTLLYAMYGAEGIAPEDFHTHWHDAHAELVRRNTYVRCYHQLFADVERTAWAVDTVGLGSGDALGIAECDFESTAAFAEMASSEMIEREAADILSISDVARNDGMLARRRS